MPSAAEPPRPDPDELLRRAELEEARARRGKLKVFFGACAGVGKTYAMLSAARQLREQGLDVVVGVAETHGRRETGILLEGLEVLAPKDIAYAGKILKEFDLDAALRRRPAVLLVDELAHSNVAGSRHPKRWQDVEELLAAGIDVYTTVNVQHLESLNDVVGGVTGIRVWETVPDSVFDLADEVVLVDLPPDDLLVRLKEGKVYIPDQAERAVQGFFRKGNLIALRELALRRTADRVDDQMRWIRRAEAGARVWQTGDALLACVGPDDDDGKVVRTAARLAARLEASWHAVYVETPKLQRLPESHRRAILKALKLAQDFGAETAVLAAQDAVEAALDYARRQNLGKVVVGRSVRPRLSRWRQRPFIRRLGESAPDIDIIAVARETGRGARGPRPAFAAGDRDEKRAQRLWGYLNSGLICLGITAVATPLLPHFHLANIAMLFLLGVVFVAFRFGRGPSVVAAVLSVAAFDFFFVPPRFTFAVSDVQFLMTFAVMLIVGLVTGHLTAGLRYQAQVGRHGAERARNLYEMAKVLSSTLTEEQVVEISDRFLQSSFCAKTAILLPDESGALRAPVPRADRPEIDLAVAQWCCDKNEPAGAGTDTLPANPQFYLPLKAPMRVRGVLVVEPGRPRLFMIPEQRRLLETFAALTAIALERIHFVSVAQETLVRIESERLRNSILAALSHDLRTPLTALAGSAEVLSFELAAGSPQSRQAQTIREQVLRMSGLVNNLLEMVRLESGEMKLRRDWQSLEEILGSALKELEPSISERPIKLKLAPDLPLVRCDALSIARVLVNLLDNALKYTPPGTPIGISAGAEPALVRVEVWDEGPGLPPGQEQAIFQRFARGERESAIPGVGLGLAISQAIVEAHGGKIWAENREHRGARFIFTLPLEAQPALAAGPGEEHEEERGSIRTGPS